MKYCVMCGYYSIGFCHNFNIYCDPDNSCEYQVNLLDYKYNY